MIKHFRILLASVIGFVIVGQVAIADPVYMVAQIQISDQEAYFNEYGPAAFATLTESDAKILAASPSQTPLEGTWVGNWSVVIEFPSPEAADSWYHSESYQNEARPKRLASTTINNMVILPAFVPPK